MIFDFITDLPVFLFEELIKACKGYVVNDVTILVFSLVSPFLVSIGIDIEAVVRV